MRTFREQLRIAEILLARLQYGRESLETIRDYFSDYNRGQLMRASKSERKEDDKSARS